MPGASRNVGRAPVRSAKRCVSRAACASADGLPTPPKSCSARSAPALGGSGRIASTAASSVELQHEMPTTSPPVRLASR